MTSFPKVLLVVLVALSGVLTVAVAAPTDHEKWSPRQLLLLVHESPARRRLRRRCHSIAVQMERRNQFLRR